MGAKELYVAVIGQAYQDATRDVSTINVKGDKEEAIIERDRALAWIGSPCVDEMSFLWYCDEVDISPEWVRRKVKSCAKL